MPTRRHFIQTSSLAAAAGLSPLQTRAAEKKAIIKKGVKFSMVGEKSLSLVDRFNLIKDVGFDGTELAVSDIPEAKAFREAVDKSGLPVHGVVNASNPDLETSIKFASDLGGDSILYTATYDKKKPLMESWNATQAIVRKGLAAAEKHQVKILIENVWASFLISALDMERYIDEINHPSFGGYFDIGNNVRWGIPEHWIEVLGDRIVKLDVKEWNQKTHNDEGLRRGFSSKIGDGTINWKAVRASLDGIGFQGWATAEVGGGDRERLADISKRLSEVLEIS